MRENLIEMVKSLITGGMGFIGSHLARRLVNQGQEVTILSRSSKKLKNIQDISDRVNLVIKDIRDIDEKEVNGMDFVYHLAGTVDNYAIKEGDPYEDISINCNGTIALLEAVKNARGKTRIFFGSTFFVNGNLAQLPATPLSPTNPLALYPITRLAAENFCKAYHNVHQLDVVVSRFTNVFGPGEQTDNKKKAGFNFMINQALRGEELRVYSGGNFIRDYIYVDDLVSACTTISEKGKSGEIYYAGAGPVKFKDLVDLIIKNCPGSKATSIDPPEFHKGVGIVDFYCDTQPLRDLGWRPLVSSEEGIRRTIEYCKMQKGLFIFKIKYCV